MGIKKTTLALAISTVLTSMVSADITGVVYKDFDLNGAKNGGDIGIEGIAITAVCEDNSTPSATTNALGQYTLAVATQGNKCRVEAIPTATSGLGASANAGGSASLVSMVSDGSAHNISVSSPASYCQASPDVAMVALPGGLEHNPTSHGSLYTLPTPSIGTFDNDEQKRIEKAKGSDTGAIWGLAWSKFENKLYSAASVKRYVDVLNTNAGAIYMTDNATNATSLFVSIPDVGYTLTNRDLSQNKDQDSMSLIGRAGLGDLDISEDGKTLYTVNLAKKELVIIDIATKGITTVTLPNPYVGAGACPNEDVRPWALTVKGSDVYIGSVCETGIESGTGAAVQKYSGNAMISTVATTNTLRYLKPKTYNPANATGDYYQNVNWNPSTSWHPHRPALTDIVFDNNGDMILGYTDLGAYARITTNSSGDIRRMCLQADGTYVDENTAEAPTACASHTQVYAGNESETYYEYYIGDFFQSTPSHPGGHPELALGGLAMQPGSSEVAISAVDATDWWQAGGLSFLDNKTGEKNSAQALVSGKEPERTIYGAKAGGMGDIEILCDAAPIEIGNYVWEDSNGDGIQDPSEPALAGVKVSLFKAGVKVGETTTDAKGLYFFGGVNNNGMTTGKVDPETAYEIRIAKADVGGKSPTTADVNTNADDVRDSDATDNGADAVIAYTTKSYGENDHTLDFGFAPAFGCVSGTLNDTTANSTETSNSITLRLTDKFGKVTEVETDANGTYMFSNIPAGQATVDVDYSDTDIPEGATWTTVLPTTLTVTQGGNCSVQDADYNLPAPVDFDPKSVASCANPSSITWDGANVGTSTEWSNMASNTSTNKKVLTTLGAAAGDTVGLKMYIEDTDGKFFDGAAGTDTDTDHTNGGGAFSAPFLTLYLGDQADPANNGNYSDAAQCAANGFGLEAGQSANLVVEFDEPVVLDNWRIRDVDSGDLRGNPQVANWNWQDGIKVTAFDADGVPVDIESKIGSAGAGLIKDDISGIIHTDPATYNNGDVAHGGGTTPVSTNGHIVLTSNFIPVSKIVITHSAGPDLACQTRSALAMAGFAVCKPIHIAGTIYDDGDADRPENGTPINKPACDSEPNGKQLYVQLVDDKGMIIDVTTLAENGDYYFDKNIKPNSNYTVVLTDENKAKGGFASQPSLPSCWNNVGDVDAANPTGALDATIDGIIPVAVAEDSIEELDFGINKKPTANPYEKPVVLNPNGNVQVPLTEDCTVSNFISDKETTGIAKIRVTTLPPANSGVLYYDGVAVTLNQEITNVDPCKFTIDPVDGDVTVGFNYVSIDAAGVESDPATVKASFNTLNVSGTLFLDSTIDTTVEGTPTSVACGDTSVPLYVSLIGDDGKVLSSKTFDTQDGSYHFNYGDGIRQNTKYTIIVSQNKGDVGANAPAIVLPESCSNAYGENIGTTGTDGTANGSIAVNVGTENIPEINFAIGQKFVKIGNRIWIEDDNDGDASTGNITKPPAGTVVTATATDGTKYTGTTDANGMYSIAVPANDTYMVTVGIGKVATAGSDDSLVPDTSAENDKSHNGAGTKVVVGTQDNMTLDFGFTPKDLPTGNKPGFVKIGDRVWIEDDNDGDASTGTITKPEAGLVVTAKSDTTGKAYTSTTDANGNYLIEVPANDTYTVTTQAPKGTCASLTCAKEGDLEVPDLTSENNKTHDGVRGTKVTVGTEDNLSVDFGFCPVTIVSGTKGGSTSYLLLSVLGLFGLRRRLAIKK